MYERSSDTLAQDGQTMRFSDEVSVAEVARLLNLVRHRPGVVSGYCDPQGNESATISEWLR